MATATFDKRIVISEEAADRLIATLRAPAPPHEKSAMVRWATEEDDDCFLQKYLARMSAQESKNR